MSKSDTSTPAAKKAKTTPAVAKKAPKKTSDIPTKLAPSHATRFSASEKAVFVEVPPRKASQVTQTKDVSEKGKTVIKKAGGKAEEHNVAPVEVDDIDDESDDGEAGATPPPTEASSKIRERTKGVPKKAATRIIDPRYEGDYAWFDAYADALESVCPGSEETPGPTEYAAIYGKLVSLLASAPSHRPCFTLKVGYKGPPVTMVGPEVDDCADSLPDHILMRGVQVTGGYVGEIEFEEGEVPGFYDLEVDLSSVHGFQARLEIPPRPGMAAGAGNLKLRRVWQCAEDLEKELFEGWWDMRIQPDKPWGRLKKGFDEGRFENGAVIWAVRHTRVNTDSDDEGCCVGW